MAEPDPAAERVVENERKPNAKALAELRNVYGVTDDRLAVRGIPDAGSKGTNAGTAAPSP